MAPNGFARVSLLALMPRVNIAFLDFGCSSECTVGASVITDIIVPDSGCRGGCRVHTSENIPQLLILVITWACTLGRQGWVLQSFAVCRPAHG